MKKLKVLFLAMVVVMLVSSVASAEDGALFRRNVSKTPDDETEKAAISHMTFYVPAQSSSGELTPVEYYVENPESGEPILQETRDYAKPLVTVYIDDQSEHEATGGDFGIFGGVAFGAHDAFSALSLDDGTTWKRSNLSLSADLSSFVLHDGQEYPGNVHHVTFGLAGDKVLAGWLSKYCDGGSPAYTWVDETTGEEIYPDIWGVAGAQSSVDYTLQGFPEVGEIPYSCVWSARGTLVPVELDETGTMGYDIIWTKPERLTSGRRDANRLEMNADGAAGFMMTWQEDPQGLRPGQGLGPGEGWSGAVVNQQTDLWYSYISVEDFKMVQTSDDDATPVEIYEYIGETMPKVAAPMALPVRLTDNKMCKEENSEPYCYIDFENVDVDGNLILPDPLPTDRPTDGSATFCEEIWENWESPGGVELDLCVAEDGRVMQGRVGASRPRVNVQPYDSDGDGVYDSAWVIMGAEESKALGEGDPLLDPEDIGKNMWYYSFDLVNPGFVMQGGMINQPAKCNPNDAANEDPTNPRCTAGEGEFYDLLTDDFDNDFYETEIARRFSHFSQPIHQIGESGVSAVLIIKQGILNQGGPADIFLQRLVVPEEDWVDCPADSPYEKCLPAGYNPYAYENMACDEWVYTDGSNPRYVEGLCLSNMINVSGGTIVSCDGVAGDCADQFPWDPEGDPGSFPKVTEWRQCDGLGSIDGCPDGDDADNDLDDQSWENPYDVAKGHRGFIDGDFVMMMYAWSPNWKSNSVGNDHYNLYARRSFDGGETWTTTPADYECENEDGTSGACDGTTVWENYGAGSEPIPVEFIYGPGDFEQSRNLSQLTGNQITILDPRYNPTGGIKMLPITDKLEVGGEDLPYADDAERDPSKYFIVYETGDNTTVAEGEAVPLDLFYSRAFNWGDDYDLVEYETGLGEIVEGFDWLEHDHDDLSGEAGNTSNPAGTFYYVVWNQWQEDEHENVSDSDMIFRRLMWIEDADRAPSSSILYASHRTVSRVEGGEVVLIGTARDGDHMGGGIVDYRWQSDIDGFLTNQKELRVPATSLSLGFHTMSFQALDAEGNWSTGATYYLPVAEFFHEVNMPVLFR